MKTPVISIIIPTYNSSKVLEHCLNSIIDQSFKNYEIVIQDGKSTDDTYNLIMKYARNEQRIIWNSEQDYGIYDAMNKAVKIANGDWILFLGSDDKLYNQNVLATLFSNSTYNEFDVIYGNVYSSRLNGIYDGQFDEEKIVKKNICHQSIFFKKSVFEKIGLFDLRFKVLADWEHNWRWFFSEKIKKEYVDLIITAYADGGLSSTSVDLVFENFKNLKLIKYAHNFFGFHRKMQWFRDAVYLRRKANDITGLIETIKHLPYVFFPFKPTHKKF